MKLAFSTVTCPNWSLDEILATASDFLYQGIEIRGVGNELYAPAIPSLNAKGFNEKLKSFGLELSCLSSDACLAQSDDAVREAKEYIDFAQKIGVKYVRVLGTAHPHLEEGDYERALKNYSEVCRYAEKTSVPPLIETNGMFADTLLLKRFMAEADSDNKGIVWDVNHPYRFHRETIRETVENIGEYIKNVHIKDSKLSDGALKYKLVGYGTMPLAEVVSSLKDIGYDGYLTLEWVKRWNRDIEEPSVIIPLFSSYFRNLI